MDINHKITDAVLLTIAGNTPRGADLSEANLSGADLSEANLRGAGLRGADLSEANLSGAGLSGADLSGANLSEADLRGADLRGVDLSGADLSGADLSGVDLSGADLSGANLRGALFPEGFRVVRMDMGGWSICIYPYKTTIGCQTHPNTSWLEWAPLDVAYMDKHAAQWWAERGEAVKAAIRFSMSYNKA